MINRYDIKDLRGDTMSDKEECDPCAGCKTTDCDGCYYELSTERVLMDNVRELKALAMREHYYHKDGWVTCPEHPYGCLDKELSGCNCGADEHNKKVIELMKEILWVRKKR